MLDFNKTLIFDGAMGTMLQAHNLKWKYVPEELNVTSPDSITEIHKAYIKAGANVIYANTFGANAYKLSDTPYSVEELVTAGVKNALKAASGTDVTVALDIGSIGKLLKPNGELEFEEAYNIFREIIICGANAGAQAVVLETMSDMYELKAGILAAKEACDLEIITTVTFEKNGKTFTGITPTHAAVTLEALGVTAMGVNCSLGPKDLLGITTEMLSATPLPVILKANAGLPDPATMRYDILPETFANECIEHYNAGVCAFGGCCGTTPEYIKLLADKFSGKPVIKNAPEAASYLTGSGKSVKIDGVKLIGERINPTGKKLFKQALIEKNIGYILTKAIEQVNAGAEILDVNVGLPEIDEKEMMISAISEIQGVTDVPLQIDSSDATVIEAALRMYNGKPIVNSVNGKDEVLESILPLCKKYGAAVVGLTLDENGLPSTAEERIAIAEKIIRKAKEYGINEKDIFIDCLTLTVSVQQSQALETLKAIKYIKQNYGVKTVLGVSNISFGLPNREKINAAFLSMAIEYGLDLPIINPEMKLSQPCEDALRVLDGTDVGAAEYIRKNSAETEVKHLQEREMTVDYAVRNGLRDGARLATVELLKSKEPMDIVNGELIPALDKVGASFEKNEIFLPQLIQAATAAQSAFEEIRLFVAKSGGKSVSKGKIILATVEGDIHDIGKNIVKVVLENYGYSVIDLGRDVKVDAVVNAAKESGALLVGLSALMTTTVVNMKRTINALRECGLTCKIMVGGAVLTEEYAMEIGADYYAKDAKQSADIAKAVFG